MSRYDEIVAGLRERFEADQRRSIMGRLRELYPVLLEMRRGGMKSAAIVDALNDLQLAEHKLSVRVFDVYMNRLKREVAEASASATSGKPKAKPIAPKASRAAEQPAYETGSEVSTVPAEKGARTRQQKGEIAAARYVGKDVNPLIPKKT